MILINKKSKIDLISSKLITILDLFLLLKFAIFYFTKTKRML